MVRIVLSLASVFFLMGINFAVAAEGDQPAPAADPAATPEPAPAPEAKAEEAPAAPVLVDQYEATYRTGSAPFPEKTKVTITKSGDGVTFTPQKKGGSGWTLPVKSIRGAQASTGGLWLFWFDDGDNTLTAHFKMEKGQDILSSDINSLVNQYHQAAFEAYRQRAEQKMK